VFLGMAAACKITALFFGPVLGIVVFWQNKKKALPKLMIASLAFFITWRLFQPYAFTGLFTPNQQFLANLASLKNFSQPDSLYPPSVQWLNTRPIFYSLKNLALWGLGTPLSVIIITSLFFFPSYLKKKKLFSKEAIYFKKGENHRLLPVDEADIDKSLAEGECTERNREPRALPVGIYYCLYFWPLALFFYQACQFVKPMRYLLPIYPLWSIIGAWGIKKIINNNRQAVSKTVWVLIGFTLIWPLSFISIYLRPHSRLQASNWIYDHISPGSTLSCEYWDDCLPLPVEGKSWQSQSYQIETLFLYDPESQEKWQKINHQLDKIDYLILSSNRLWGSIPKNPKRYPETTKFYQDLFQEKLQFNKVAEFSSLPCFPPGLNWFCFNDQRADESFTVYDHPQVIIYQKANHSNQ
ncbi:MAG: tetratricopeptide TPR_4, partial [Microgenomates bacterium 39_6]